MSLPEPDFVERDAQALEAEMIADFEAAAGRVLRPAQVERLLIEAWAYRELLVRQAIQDAAKQCLVRYARAPMLDYLGELVGCSRLGPSAARTTLRVTLTEALGVDKVIPATVRVRSKDGQAAFSPIQLLTIPAGSLQGDVTGECSATGLGGNGYAAGDIAEVMDPIPGVASIVNVTTSSGGAAEESDSRYRQRIMEASEAFSVAGSKGAYRYHAMGVSSAIVDCSVISPSPGAVRLYLLTDQGLPSAELLEQVEAAVSGEQVRPLTDAVEVDAPEEVEFSIEADLTLYSTADPDTVSEEAERRLTTYRSWIQAKLGRDIVPGQVLAALQTIPGVYSVQLSTPLLQVLGLHQWAHCTGWTVDLVGVVDG